MNSAFHKIFLHLHMMLPPQGLRASTIHWAAISTHWSRISKGNVLVQTIAATVLIETGLMPPARTSSRHHIVRDIFDQDRKLVVLGPQVSPIVGVYSLLYFI